MLDDWKEWISASDKQVLRSREGMDTWRIKAPYPRRPTVMLDLVVKRAYNDSSLQGLRQAWRVLHRIDGLPYAPFLKLLLPTPSPDFPYLVYNYVFADPYDPDKAYAALTVRHAIKMVGEFHRLGVVHGDLTSPNIIISDDIPVAVDWEESRFGWESYPIKRPEPDFVHLFPAILSRREDPLRTLQRWMGVYEHIEYFFGHGSFLDLGCHTGEFCGIARALGMVAYGVDDESIRPCIDTAAKRWPDCYFYSYSAEHYVQHLVQQDVIMMCSTWPYMHQKLGDSHAREVLSKCIKTSHVFLFETQLFGDGPGLEITKTKDDVVKVLREAGAKEIDEAVTVPVIGRDAERTTFAVRG